MDYGHTTAQGAITSLYQFVTRLHNSVPYHVSKEAYAFPAWHYFFEVTRRCNLRCKMCQYIEFLENVPVREQRDGELSTEEWLNVIDQTGPLSLITFTGGEVWVRKDFPALLERACSKRRVHFISNAVMLDDEKSKFCVGLAPKHFGFAGLNFVGISIDGSEDVHDVVRAQKGAFQRSIDGIKNLIKWRTELKKSCPLIHMNTVILNENLDILPTMPDLAKDAGVNVLNLLTEMRGPDNQDLGHVDPGIFGPDDVRTPRIDRARLDAALKKTIARATELGVEVRLPRMPYENVLDHYDGGYDLKHMGCRSIWTNLYVGSKGNAYPCWLQKVGNVKEHSLKKLWNNHKMREFRQRRRKGAFEVCRGCCEIEYSEKPFPGRGEVYPTRNGDGNGHGNGNGGGIIGTTLPKGEKEISPVA